MSEGKEAPFNDESPVSTVCWMCSEKFDGKGNCKHKGWCEKITRKIYSRYSRTFREIYNILELALDEDKAKIAKDLAGNKLMEARNDSIRLVSNYFRKDSVI